MKHWLRQARFGRRAPWVLFICAASAASLAAAFAVLVLHRTRLDVQASSEHIASTQVQFDQAKRTLNNEISPVKASLDFARRLPSTVDARTLLQELGRSVATTTASLTSVQLQERAATFEQLARSEVTVSLRGSYPQLKQVLADVLARFPNVTLAQWRLRRTGQQNEVDATMTLVLWGAPATAMPPSIAGASRVR